MYLQELQKYIAEIKSTETVLIDSAKLPFEHKLSAKLIDKGPK